MIIEPVVGKPLWEEMIGLTLEVGALRQEYEHTIKALRAEVAELKENAQKPLESTEILKGTTQVLQEELSNCLRTLAAQQNEIEQMKRAFAKNARLKKDDDNATPNVAEQQKKMADIASIVEGYNFARKDDVDKVRNVAKVAARKAESTVEELHSVRRDVLEVVKTELKKVSADRATVGQLQKMRKSILDDVEKAARKSDKSSESTTDSLRRTEVLASDDVSRVVTACHDEIEVIRNDLTSFRGAHQSSFDQSVETFSKIDSVLNDVTGKTREAFAQIDIVSVKVQDLRDETRRNQQDLRTKVDQINNVVETQLESIVTLLADIGCKIPRLRSHAVQNINND